MLSVFVQRWTSRAWSSPRWRPTAWTASVTARSWRRRRKRRTTTASRAAPATPATRRHIPTDCSHTTVRHGARPPPPLLLLIDLQLALHQSSSRRRYALNFCSSFPGHDSAGSIPPTLPTVYLPPPLQPLSSVAAGSESAKSWWFFHLIVLW